MAVLDGIGGLPQEAIGPEVASAIARQIDLLKGRGITVYATTIARDTESSGLNISSLVDTWLLLRNVESNGERNWLLFILKSRGSAHSNKVREFRLTNEGPELVEVTLGPDGVVVGSARRAQDARKAGRQA